MALLTAVRLEADSLLTTLRPQINRSTDGTERNTAEHHTALTTFVYSQRTRVERTGVERGQGRRPKAVSSKQHYNRPIEGRYGTVNVVRCRGVTKFSVPGCVRTEYHV
jgi:hypothetical protein